MGAFENQIYENETFASLLELYREALNENRALQSELKALKDRVEEFIHTESHGESRPRSGEEQR